MNIQHRALLYRLTFSPLIFGLFSGNITVEMKPAVIIGH